MTWELIESCPIGTPVLVYHPEYDRVYEAVVGIYNGKYLASDPRYSEWDDEGPTHWMAIPEAPK